MQVTGGEASPLPILMNQLLSAVLQLLLTPSFQPSLLPFSFASNVYLNLRSPYPLRKAFRGAISCIKGTKKELLRDHSGGHIYTPTQGRKHIVHRNNWNTYSCRREEKKYEDERPNQHSTSQSCHRMMSWSSSGSPPEKRS